jgi:serine protease inhibitor
MAQWARVVLIGVLLGLGLVAGVPVHAQPAPQASGCAAFPTAGSASASQLVAADNAFGFRLLNREMSAGGNVFFSPLSVSLALDMAYDGARGGTAADMAQALGLRNRSQAVVRSQAASLLSALHSSGAGLSVANSLWARRGIQFRTAFLHDMRDSYGATARRLDFSSPAAPATINHWVSCATQGKIPSIIRAIPSDVILYLIDAVYFHGDWARQFALTNTHTRPFTTASGARIRVPLMSQLGTFPYYHGPNFQLIALPYKTSRFSMLVLEPKGSSLSSFARGMNAATWQRWTAGLKTEQGMLALPRFSLTNQFTLNGPLSALGMRTAFTSSADFSGICLQRCRLSQVRHKTYLAINERGTVAAAATSVGVQPVAVPSRQFQMTVDHPFFLAIRDSQTGAILFLGAVGKP